MPHAQRSYASFCISKADETVTASQQLVVISCVPFVRASSSVLGFGNTSPVSPTGAWSGRIEKAHPPPHLVGKVKRAKKSRSGSQFGPTKRTDSSEALRLCSAEARGHRF
eukprot:7240684-Prymnesium_polylepis.1